MNLQDLLDSPQLGEYAFNQVTADPGIAATSERHFQRMVELAGATPQRANMPHRVLEVGAYRHYSGHLLADRMGSEVVLTDISMQALETGRTIASEAGVRRHAELCAADFHGLPFTDGYFDLVFVASSIHHTLRPEVVIREMLRVLRPGGVLWVDNEPVGRELCAYRFRGNRPEGFTAFERALHDAGLLGTVSSPFVGSRPEELFGMVENDRIALDLYLDELGCGTTIERMVLDIAQTTTGLDHELLQAKGRTVQELAQSIFRSLAGRVDALPVTAGPLDRALGFSLPSVSDWWTLSHRAAAAVFELRHVPDAVASDRVLARLFGAALQAMVRKRDARGADRHAGERFKVPMTRRGNCWIEAGASSVAALLELEAVLPDVHDRRQRAQVESAFDPASWVVVEEEFGANSLSNRVPAPVFEVAIPVATALLLMRIYVVAASSGPYTLVVRQGSRTLCEFLVAQSESRLLKALVHQGGGPVMLESRDCEGRPLDLVGHARIGVFQILVPAR